MSQTTANAPTPSVGVILPPNEIRKIADKTAEFVAKNGSSFEELVIQQEAKNPKFSFLKKDDPYRAYYDSMVAEYQRPLIESQRQQIQQMTAQANEASKTQQIDQQNTTSLPYQQQATSTQQFNSQQIGSTQNSLPSLLNNAIPTNQLQQSAILTGASTTTNASINYTQQSQLKKEIQQQQTQREIKPPPPDQFTVKAPKGINQLDLDIIKHTAQFVAKNGNKFLIELTEREKFNAQFDFVKPNHSLFYFFTSMVDAYSKCIIPKNPDLKKLQENITDRNILLQRLIDRFDFENNQFEQKKKKEDMDNEERLQLQQIDWSDFVVVETIDLFDNEDLPAPALLDKNKLNPLLQNKLHNTNLNDLLQKDVDEKQLLLQQQQQLQQPQAQPLLPVPQQQLSTMGPQLRPIEITSEPQTNLQNQLNIDQIKALQEMETNNEENLNKPSQQQFQKKVPDLSIPQSQEMVKCQVCGNNIPAAEYNEHIRIELLDPKYKDIKNQVEQRIVNTTSSTNTEFQSYLSQFAKRRPDIFGTVDDQLTQTSVKNKQVQKGWDGQSETMTRTTASIVMLAQQQKKTQEENLKLAQPDTVEQQQKQTPFPPQQQQAPILNPLIQPPQQGQQPLSLLQQPLQQQQQTTAPTLFMPHNPLQQPPQIPIPQLNQQLPTQPQTQQQQQQLPQTLIPKPLIPGVPLLPGGGNQPLINTPQQQNVLPPVIPSIGGITTMPQQNIPLITPPPQNIFGGLVPKPQTLLPIPTPLNTNINTNVITSNVLQNQPPQELILIPEQEWIDKHPETILVNIKVPTVGGEDTWNFKGQIVQASLDPKNEIQAIKNIIFDSLNMPQSKQKLKFKGNVLKDNKTVGFYNLLNDCFIELAVKERGGKKK